MSLTQLGNEKQILGACRSYRRACRRLAKVEHSAHANGWSDELTEAREKVLAVRDRLLYFVETGSRAYPNSCAGKR